MVVGLQRRVIDEYTRVSGDLEEMIEAYDSLIKQAEKSAKANKRGAEQMSLLVRIMEWRRENSMEDFNELVMWDLAEELDIDRELASEVYDRIVSRGESGEAE